MLVRTGVNQLMDFGANDMRVSRRYSDSQQVYFKALFQCTSDAAVQCPVCVSGVHFCHICRNADDLQFQKRAKVAYAAAKQGVHTLPDGRVFEAGEVDTMARPLNCNIISGSWT